MVSAGKTNTVMIQKKHQSRGTAKMTTITINGNRMHVTGSNVSIVNGTVIVNGITITEGLSGIVTVKWEGDLASLQSDASVTCQNVHGNVSAGGSVSWEM